MSPRMPIYLAAWNITKEEHELAERVRKFIINTLPEELRSRDIKIHDLKVYGDLVSDGPVLLFGTANGQDVSAEPVFHVCKLKDMLGEDHLKHKRKVTKKIEELTAYIESSESESKVEKYIETPEGITVGGIGADIQITEEEANHLKRIKEILGGGKMVITKGDLKIEVE
jgi:hypothetical protein